MYNASLLQKMPQTKWIIKHYIEKGLKKWQSYSKSLNLYEKWLFFFSSTYNNNKLEVVLLD